MEKNIPLFEVNGQRYEIIRTRYLIAEYEKRKKELSMSEEDEIEYQKEKEKQEALQRLAERKDELWETYLETFEESDKAKYKLACSAYDELVDEIAKSKNVLGTQLQRILDIMEQLIITSLQWDMNGNTIRTAEEANAIWCSYVDEVGTVNAKEFVGYTANYIVGGGEEENPFVAKAKAKAEAEMQRKAGFRKIK